MEIIHLLIPAFKKPNKNYNESEGIVISGRSCIGNRTINTLNELILIRDNIALIKKGYSLS